MRLIAFFAMLIFFSACADAASNGTRKVVSNSNNGKATLVNWDSATVYHVADASPRNHVAGAPKMHRLYLTADHHSYHHSQTRTH